MLSATAKNNLITMGICSAYDSRQDIPDTRIIPTLETRKLRAMLILEEALETIHALGIQIVAKVPDYRLDSIKDVIFFPKSPPPFLDSLADIVDGCCDTIYVCVGTLMSCGVADELHMNAVNHANLAKFPGGKGIFNEHGKYLKPYGWKPPDHNQIFLDSTYNLRKISEDSLKAMRGEK